MRHSFLVPSFLVIALTFSSQEASSQSYHLDSALVLLRETRLIQEEKADSDSTLVQDSAFIQVPINGEYVNALVSEGDTLYISNTVSVHISSPRTFSSREDYLRYRKYRRYATKVYPFAKEAIRIFREAEYVTQNMKKRKRKKYLRKLSKELKKEFEDPLKSLSKTQGKILVKMIERELDRSMFDLIKMTNGKFKAFYWNQSSKLYGYRLKHGYIEGHNPILDVVLQDFDVSHEINQ